RQRAAHRRPAHSEPARQLHLRESRTRGQLPAEDELAQCVHGAARRRGRRCRGRRGGCARLPRFVWLCSVHGHLTRIVCNPRCGRVDNVRSVAGGGYFRPVAYSKEASRGRPARHCGNTTTQALARAACRRPAGGRSGRWRTAGRLAVADLPGPAETPPRKRVRELLAADRPVGPPGSYDALSARLVEQAGFDIVDMTGFGTTASLIGRPDVGLLSGAEMIDNATRIVSAVDVPVIADADTGYGNAING